MTDFRPEPPKQKNARGPAVAMLAAAVAVVGGAGGLTAVSEGKRNAAYVDTLATSRVITICYGTTGGVRLGDYKTDAECRTLLAQGLVSHARQIMPNIKRDISAKTLGAFVDFGYNVGPAAFNKSSILRDWNAGRERQACDDILKYRYSGGQDCFADGSRCRGIKIRREAQRKLCLEGLD